MIVGVVREAATLAIRGAVGVQFPMAADLADGPRVTRQGDALALDGGEKRRVVNGHT